jgi:hypothetical protein
MKRRFSKFETDEGCKGFQEEPQANDVVVATSPKAGTTWMQQVYHQIQSKENIDFEETSAVIP